MNPPKMPIHIGDYHRDTGHLRAAQHGAYLLLLFHHWSTGELPTDDEQLAAIARMDRKEWLKAKPILQKFFDAEWIHGRVQKDLASAKESYEKRAKAGSQGGKAKATGKQSSSNATAPLEQPLTFNQGTKEERKKDTRAAPLDDGWPDDFGEQFWQAYPRKTDKLAAMKKLASVRKSGIVSWPDLMAGVKRYAAIPRDPQYTKHAATWLNAGSWSDETPAGGHNGHRDQSASRRSASSDFFAGMRSVAEDLAGDSEPSRDVDPEIPLGRFNIDAD